MNRFGIRLAAGLAVICLGSLAILQAQQDKNEAVDTEWPSANVASSEPPAPLGINDDWPAPPDSNYSTPLVRGNDGYDGYEAPPVNQFTNPIQLSSYEQSAEGPDVAENVAANVAEDTTEDVDYPYDSGGYANFSTAMMPASENQAEDTSPAAGPVGGEFSIPTIEVPTIDTYADDAATSSDSTDLPAPLSLAPLPAMQNTASVAAASVASDNFDAATDRLWL